MESIHQKMLLPTFLCVGAQKAGTTTLHQLLSRHPQIFLPDKKELHYFSLNFDKNLKWYEKWFYGSEQCIQVGEITPYYIFHPYAAKRIIESLGRIKIIILLRDPIKRSISHYLHSFKLGHETLSIEGAFAAEKERLAEAEIELKSICGRHVFHQECSYISRSLYKSQVERYLDFFGASNVLIIPSEFFFSQPEIYLAKILSFLGVEQIPILEKSLLHVHANAAKIDLNGELSSKFMRKMRQALDESYSYAQNSLNFKNELNWNW
ncbi:sulfotransferase [Synechococcus sp. UW69]|uniref:sulfotransferase family protein n=1 Tax=Synechococcus sp. UW69 TaxID=368493 RepID=UPI0014822DF5|nr:sulfotransferase [Synechococcus sp. UW69]